MGADDKIGDGLKTRGHWEEHEHGTVSVGHLPQFSDPGKLCGI